jgi:hypothetical protein
MPAGGENEDQKTLLERLQLVPDAGGHVQRLPGPDLERLGLMPVVLDNLRPARDHGQPPVLEPMGVASTLGPERNSVQHVGAGGAEGKPVEVGEGQGPALVGEDGQLVGKPLMVPRRCHRLR